MGPEFIEIVLSAGNRLYINANYITMIMYDRLSDRTDIHVSGIERPYSIDGNKSGDILRQIEAKR